MATALYVTASDQTGAPISGLAVNGTWTDSSGKSGTIGPGTTDSGGAYSQGGILSVTNPTFNVTVGGALFYPAKTATAKYQTGSPNNETDMAFVWQDSLAAGSESSSPGATAPGVTPSSSSGAFSLSPAEMTLGAVAIVIVVIVLLAVVLR